MRNPSSSAQGPSLVGAQLHLQRENTANQQTHCGQLKKKYLMDRSQHLGLEHASFMSALTPQSAFDSQQTGIQRAFTLFLWGSIL